MVGKRKEDEVKLPDAVPSPPQGQEAQGRPEARDDRTPEQRAGAHTDAAKEAAEAQPSTPPANTPPEKVDVLQRTITTLGEVTHETRPGFDAGGTPVIPNAPLRNQIRAIGDFPRTYDEAVLIKRYKAGEIDEFGRPVEESTTRDAPDESKE